MASATYFCVVGIVTEIFPAGEIFVSDEIFGNELSHNLHVDGLAGKIGTMRVELKEAHLYALGSNMCESR